MPSKTKKHSKSASKLSQSDQTPASPFSSSSLTPNSDSDSELNEDEVSSYLEVASSKYPNLIGTTAFVGRITEDVVEECKGCKIWLSDSSMVSSSIPPGSVVSVSLVSSRKKFSTSTPLSSLVDECARQFGFEDKRDDEVGNYFALATVFPSCKVSNNGVRLSSNLQCTLGSPASGRIVFVYPIHTQLFKYLANGNGKSNNATTNLSLYICKEIFLEFVSSKSGFTLNNNMLSCNNSAAENGKISSPKTPSFSRSKLSSPSSSQLTPQRYEESASKFSNLNGTPFDSFDLNEVLGDESAKKLLQTCSTSWLCSRNLLHGNFVMIPVLSKLCIFQVVGANKVSTTSSIPNGTTKGNINLLPQDPNLVDHLDHAFVVDRETKVHLYSPLNSSVEVESAPRRGLPRLELERKDIGANVGVDFPRLGGLSKEYAVLKEIILSSVKSTLSSFGLRPTKGVLLHGPPGTGKTSLARLCTHDAGVSLFTVNGPEIVTQYHGESGRALHEVFESASRALDELHPLSRQIKWEKTSATTYPKVGKTRTCANGGKNPLQHAPKVGKNIHITVCNGRNKVHKI